MVLRPLRPLLEQRWVLSTLLHHLTTPLQGTEILLSFGEKEPELNKLAIVLTVSLPTVSQAPHIVLRAA